MDIVISIIAFILIFSGLVLIHEFGHFMVARWVGIKVEEFGLGIPPKIWGFKPKKSETEYTLNAIPFGGFVRLYGEDLHDAKARKSTRSYVGKPAWARILVVIAGVVMNLLLAWFLLMIGFVVGMQPIFTSLSSFLEGVNQGKVEVENGLYAEVDGERKQIVTINGEALNIWELESGFEGQLNLGFADGMEQEIMAEDLVLDDFIFLQKPLIYDVKNSDQYEGELILNWWADDQMMNVFFNPESREEITGWQNNLDSAERLMVEGEMSRNDFFGLGEEGKVVIADLINEESPAAEVGVRAGDLVVSVNGHQVESLEDFTDFVSQRKRGQLVDLTVLRNNQEVTFFIEPDESERIGVFVTEMRLSDSGEIAYYLVSYPVTIKEIKNEVVPLIEAPGKAIGEMAKLSVVTVQMFGVLIGQVFTSFSVPEGVAGPVGIAAMTHTYVQQGFSSLIQFVALISLSLGIVNILPIPGLDGGRLMLIIVNMLIGNKMDARVEGMINVFGFLFLIGLIFLITFNDIFRLIFA